MMLGLPKSNPDKDIKSFKKIFEDSNFKPDMIKIYPLVITRGTKIYEMWKNGEYEPYDKETLEDLIYKIYKIIPPWVRVMRIQRDIPSTAAEYGVFESIRHKLETSNEEFNEIRWREIGHKHIKKNVPIRYDKVKIDIIEYSASEGKEYFIQAIDEEYNALYGICRLRIGTSWLYDCAYIRELHVYGAAVSIGSVGDIQHRGIGRKLVETAEDIAKQYYDYLRVISGIGVRKYYEKLGYSRDLFYMGKKI